jgi:hypothetical protein
MCTEIVPLDDGNDKESTIILLKIKNEDFDAHQGKQKLYKIVGN